MSRAFGLMILCVLLAVLKAAVVALAIALGLLLLVALIRQPRDTLLCLVTLGLIGLANAKPLACIVAATVVAVAVVLAGRTRKPTRAKQLPRLR